MSAFKYAGNVDTSVFPSPVRISAILPSCSAIPPISCTSKWRILRTRLEASRTVANASGKILSKVSFSERRFLNSSVFAARASSDNA